MSDMMREMKTARQVRKHLASGPDRLRRTAMPKSTCSIDECERPELARKMCGMHYQRARRAEAPECSFRDCGRPVARGGLCESHFRMDAKGIPLRPVLNYAFSPRGLSTEERLEMNSGPVTDGGCRIWQGGSDDGYPLLHHTSMGTKLAHRIAYMTSTGDKVPSHVPIHHRCGNSMCVEPTHLFPVTPIENTAEMLERNFYVKRIEALEDALRESNPDHPLLEVADK